MNNRERIARILCRQFLTSPGEKETVCQDLCGFQAQFLSNSRHALAIRCGMPLTEPWGQALLKSWTLRGTVHVFAEKDLPLMLHAGRNHFLRPKDTMENDEFAAADRKSYFAALIQESLSDGPLERETLRTLCREHGMTDREEESLFDPWGGLLRALAEAGKIAHVVQEKKAFIRCPAFEPMPLEAAQLELARRYFTAYGPATVRDAAYFFGVNQKTVKGWMDRLPVEGNGCYSISDGRSDWPEIPACLFLAGFDPLLMGYEKKESFFLPPAHLRQVFSLAGIVSPTVLLHGQIAARWKRTGKKLQLWPFRELTALEQTQIQQTAERVFGPVQITL